MMGKLKSRLVVSKCGGIGEHDVWCYFIEMPEKYAVVVGIEQYREARLQNVSYAKQDATAFAEALKQLGHEQRNVALLLDDDATAVTIDYEARQMAKSAQKGDELMLFFAGHGYTMGSRNYLLAADTKQGDIVGTSVPLQRLLEHFAQSSAERITCFLDCCHSGMNLGDEERGVIEQMSEDELKKYFQNAEYRVVFSACSSNEKSYPSIKYKPRLLDHHLLRALRGMKPHVLDKSRRLLSTTLQDYLRSEVPKQVKLESIERRSQNPKMYGDLSGTFVVADLKELLDKKNAELELRQSGFKDFIFRGTRSGAVNELAGFEKARGHRAPKFVSRRTQEWVAGLAARDIEEELTNVFGAVRKCGLQNSSIRYDEATEGSGAIRTTDFEFVVTYKQSDEESGAYDVIRELNRLSNPRLIEERWFNDIFRRFRRSGAWSLTRRWMSTRSSTRLKRSMRSASTLI